MPEYRAVLRYFTDDDGIWLVCGCGYETNLGFDPTPVEAMDAMTAHQEERNANKEEPQ